MKWTKPDNEALRQAIRETPPARRADQYWRAVASRLPTERQAAAVREQAARLGLARRDPPLAVFVALGYGLVCECGARVPWGFLPVVGGLELPPAEAMAAGAEAWAKQHAPHRRRYHTGD